MKKLTYAFLMSASVLLFSCNSSSSDKAHVTDAQEEATASEAASTLSLDLEKSVVTWIGSKPAGKHNGTIQLSEGTISVEDGMVTAGEFTMDMATVRSTDAGMDEDKNAQLTDHLKSADFFDVAKYPKARFSIVSVEDIADHATEDALQLEGATHYVTGNLMMKDSTKAVKFPAIIDVSDSGVKANASFKINRTDWGMSYKSDESFANKIIYPSVEVGFNIVAK